MTARRPARRGARHPGRPGRAAAADRRRNENCRVGRARGLHGAGARGRPGLEVEQRFGLGRTKVCWSALLEGGSTPTTPAPAGRSSSREEAKVGDPLRTYLWVQKRSRERWDVAWLLPFGLDNTCMRVDEEAGRAPPRRHPDLRPARAGGPRGGFSIEFMNREDGSPGPQSYPASGSPGSGQLGTGSPAAIRNGEIRLIDAYQRRQAKLLAYDLRVLEDDRRFFPPYAAPVLREATLRALPEVRDVLERLAFRLPDAAAQRLNHRVEEEGATASAVALTGSWPRR
ncbi:MAG: glycine betaine ABC transporter substrate-binding protein [Planctomycetota bacterium]